MPGFGDFDTFAFDDGDATEDPFGVAASARETQWWTPYGASTRKKRGVTIGGFGGGGRRQTQTQGSYYDPNMAGPDPGYGTPSPSTTQRAILDAKQKQEDAARIFGGEAPREDPSPGAFMSDNQTWLGRATDDAMGKYPDSRYLAPDPTNPGQQDQARSATVDNAMLDEFRADEKRAKELEDAAMALPARTGITWGGAGTGSIEMKRNKYLQDAQILRARNAYRRASLSGGQQQEVKTVGNLVYDPNIPRAGGGRGDYVYPDAEKVKAMHKASGGTTQAPHLESLIEPRTGKTVRGDVALIPRNAQGQLVEKWFERDPKLQGPQQPGVDSLGETKEEPYGVPDPAALQTAQWKHDNPTPKAGKDDGALTAGNRIAISAQKRQVDAEINRRIAEVKKDATTPKAIAAAKITIAELEAERKRQYDRIDADTAPTGATPKPKAGAVGGVKWRKVG